jgi:hypothetical protein
VTALAAVFRRQEIGPVKVFWYNVMLFNYRAVYWPNCRAAHLCVLLYENLILDE